MIREGPSTNSGLRRRTRRPARLARGVAAALAAATMMLVAPGCALVGAGDGTAPSRPCTPSFEDAGGWLGGDAAWSVEITDLVGPSSDRQSLWLFGDSFVARDDHSTHRTYPFIHNTVARSRCTSRGDWSIEYFWRARESERPRAFFTPDPDAAWVRHARATSGHPPYYWPFGSIVHAGHVFVGLLRIAESEPQGRFALPFRILGVDLARLTPTRAPIDAWPLRIRTLSESEDLIPAAAFVIDADFVHAFAFLNEDSGRHPRTLVRWPLGALDAYDEGRPFAFETLTRDGTWQSGLRPAEARILMPEDSTEMSVHWDGGRRRWISVESGAASEGGGVGWRQAPDLTGPWSPLSRLIDFPNAADDDALDSVFCYAGKAHPQYSTAMSLVVSYVCNLYAPANSPDAVVRALDRLRVRRDLYRPVVSRVPFP